MLHSGGEFGGSCVHSICITTLWVQRNRVVHEHKAVTLERCVQEFKLQSLRQLLALAARERRQIHKEVDGVRLMQCMELLTLPPSRASSTAVSHVQPPGSLDTGVANLASDIPDVLYN
uniref:RxLR effector candidate protein n=1 Tax=Hyaloperonospora arabidopsidis (strain Emoy2) TaxID=559515 RepID=M4BZS2_HYAAE